jgi:hypothetical protein
MSGLSDTYFEEVRYNNISTDEIKERETVIKNVFFHIDKAYTLLNKKNKEVTT